MRAPSGSSVDGKDDAARRFSSITKFTNTNLDALRVAARTVEESYRGAYRFNKVTDEPRSQVSRMNRVKEAMHRYMCSYFDESIDLGLGPVRSRGGPLSRASREVLAALAAA